MKLTRVGAVGAERPALLDEKGKLRDLSGVVTDIGGNVLNRNSLESLRRLDIQSLPRCRRAPASGPQWDRLER